MDYEKKYKEALTRAKTLIEKLESNHIKGFIYNILPELKESKDEKIRKDIMWCLKHAGIKDDSLINPHVTTITKDAIAWLEKQGEQKPVISDDALREGIVHFGITQYQITNWLKKYVDVGKQGEQKQETNYPKFDFDDILAIQCCMEAAKKVTEDKELYEKLKSLHNRLLDAYWIEKQSGKPQGKTALEAINEEKVDNSNKIESMFKVGDWIVRELDNSVHQVKAVIENISNGKYGYDLTSGGYISSQDANFYHLWTIKDAKDGDVLHSPSHHLIWIYRDNEHYYACVNMNYVKENFFIDGFIVVPNDVCPATKDEQTILFARMKEAGYVWDADKKESKKIVAPKFGVGDTMRTLQEASSGITSGLPVVVSIDNEYYHCNNELIAIKDQNNYEYPPMNKKPVEWSEQEGAEKKAEEYRNYRMSCGIKDPVMLNEIEEAYYEGAIDNRKPTEWSAEDKSNIQEICKILDSSKKYFADCKEIMNYIAWLKSLRPQNTWKPSDEQIKHLTDAVDDAKYRNNISTNGYKPYLYLSTLLQQLKKLKG